MENQEELMELLLSITLCIAHGTQKARVLSLPSFIFLSCKSALAVLFKDFLTVTVFFLRFYDSDDTQWAAMGVAGQWKNKVKE